MQTVLLSSEIPLKGDDRSCRPDLNEAARRLRERSFAVITKGKTLYALCMLTALAGLVAVFAGGWIDGH